MDFTLSEEQLAFAESVDRWSSLHFDLDRVRGYCDGGDYQAGVNAVWEHAAAQDWLRLCIPERWDGLGQGWLDACVLARSWSAALLPGPITTTLIAARAIAGCGSEDQQRRWLTAVASGDCRLGVVLSHGNGPMSLDRVKVRATAGGRLNGACGVVEEVSTVDRLVVAAVEPSGGLGLWLVDPTGPGVNAAPCRLLDLTSRAAIVDLDEAPGERLEGSGTGDWQELGTLAASITAAELAGLAHRALDLTVAYAISRVQFDRPIGSFQAVKHRLAELLVHVTMAEHGWRYAGFAVDAALPDVEFMSHVAKAKASDVGRDATAAMIQYHGGIGFAWEHPAHLFFKRAKRKEYFAGDASSHRERVAEALAARVESGGRR